MLNPALGEYEVRVNPRAKRPRLMVTVDQRLVAVIPKRFPKKDVPALFERHLEWLNRASAKMKAIRESVGRDILDEQERTLPRIVFLRCVGEEWTVEYREREGLMIGVELCEFPAETHDSEQLALGSRIGSEDGTEGGRLVVSGQVSHEVACREVLRRWLRAKAKQCLEPLLRDISLEMGWGFTKTVIRAQRSRWASYSPAGTVSLNLKMMFLPADLVRHVLIHELCHSIHLNHSPGFWSALAQRDPGFLEHAAELKTAFKYIPKWVEMDKDR